MLCRNRFDASNESRQGFRPSQDSSMLVYPRRMDVHFEDQITSTPTRTLRRNFAEFPAEMRTTLFGKHATVALLLD